MPSQGQWVNGPKEVSMARRRYQKGSLVPKTGIPKNGLWIGRWREDVIQSEGTITRPYKWEVLGTLQDYPTRKLALRALEARLSTINSPTYRARPTATFAEFANRWDATVLSQHKPSTQSSTRSQLRNRLLPELGNCALKDLDGERLQAFVSGCHCNAKTIRNLVATLRMMWSSARAWSYVAHDPFTGLVLPKRGLVQTFTFSLEETQRIVASASEPYKTFYSIPVKWGMVGRMQNTGQACVAAKRFIIHEKIADTFVSRFKNELEKLKPGDPMDPETSLGPLCTEGALNGVLKQIDTAVKGGAKVLLGGKKLNRRGFFLEPTILTDVKPDNPAFHQEFFAPVAMVFRVTNEKEAVDVANDSPYGLGATVITKDVERGKRIARQVDSGMVFINQATGTAPDLPFGGVKNSGYGRELSHLGIGEFVNKKLIRVA